MHHLTICRSRGAKTFNEDIIYERETRERKERDWEIERTRRRSLSPARSSSMFGKPKTKDMWTEVTKDLVIKEAIESMGFEYEETEAFFYVMEYLRYVSNFSATACDTITDQYTGGRAPARGALRRYPTQARSSHPPD